jgi:hypothetical protein
MKRKEKYHKIDLRDFLEKIDNDKLFWIAKRLSGNDTGLTGGHQVGVYLPRKFFETVFKEICTKKTYNPDAFLPTVYFPSHDFYIEKVRAIYYNNKFFPEKGKRKKYDEFRLTKWGGRECPIQDKENTGAILLLAPIKNADGSKNAIAWISNNIEEETIIEEWVGNEIFPGEFYGSHKIFQTLESNKKLLEMLPKEWKFKFPTGYEIFKFVEKMVSFDENRNIEQILMIRREKEFEIFMVLEKIHFMSTIKKGFNDIGEFVELANSITNKRKSRSGFSLEFNLESIFKYENIMYQKHVLTEQNKKPDFIFPAKMAYDNMEYPSTKLNMLAAKTCCKDRWRQVINEADRIWPKHLFTLQQGVSDNQLKEMEKERVILVVPDENKQSFPKNWRSKILNLKGFIDIRRKVQEEK